MRTIGAVILALLLSGCTKLSVKVSIFDRKLAERADPLYVAEIKGDSAADRVDAALSEREYDRVRSDLKVEVLERLPGLGLADGDVDPMRRAINAAIDKAIERTSRSHENAMRQWRKAQLLRKPDERIAQYHAANSLFARGDQSLMDLRRAVAHELDQEAVTLSSPPRANELAAIEQRRALVASAGRAVASLAALPGVLDDPHAPFVINSPKRFWKGIPNQTNGFGALGNTDVAVKMEGPGSFTLKGIRLDSSKITAATFKVLKQAVSFAAAASGVVAPAGTGGTTSAVDSAGSEILTAEEDERGANEKLRLARQARVAILDAMLSRRAALLDPNAQVRTPAIDALKKAYGNYSTELVP